MKRSLMNARKPKAPRTRRLGAHAALGLASSLVWMVLMPAAAVAAVAPQIEPGSVTLTATTITAPVGGHVTFTATASDPGGTAEYQWWVEEPTGHWVQEQGYATRNTFTLSTPSAGDYLVAVEVMDQKQVAAGEWSLAQTTLARGVFVDSVVSAGLLSGETAGQPVTLTAAATNIYAALYQFWVETPQGQWTQSGVYSSATTFTFTPETPGNYRYVAYAKSPLAANNPTGALISNVGSATVLGAAAGVTVAAASPTFTANGSGTDHISVTVTNASGQSLAQFSGQVTLLATGNLFDGGTAASATVAIAGGSGSIALALPSSGAGTYAVTAENLTANGGLGVAPQVTYGQATVTGLYPMLSVGWGYFYPGNAYGGYYDLTHNYSQMTAIAPDWYELNVTSSGTVGTPAFATYPPSSMTDQVRATASADHVMMWPSVGWYGGGSLDVLRSPANVSAIVSGMVHLAVSSGYQGMTIDFEGMGGASATTSADPTPAYQVFDNFVAALSSGLHAAGKTLMVAVYPAAYPYTIYDYSALAQSANYLNVMGYPEYNTGYPTGADPYPGPTAGYPWLKSLLSGDLTTGVNPHQLIVGLAPYGHGWTYTTTGYVCGQTGYPGCQGYISNYGAQALIAASSGTIQPVWDPWEKEEVFTAGPLATAPPAGLSSATSSSGPSDAVRSLQNLLNYVLIREAVQSGQAAPPLLVTDGYYGPVTTSAVALLQKDLNVATTSGTAGVYGAATEAALAALIQQWHIGSTVYWTETSRATTDKMKLIIADRLGGVAMWRLGFETANYWSGMATVATAIKAGSG